MKIATRGNPPKTHTSSFRSTAPVAIGAAPSAPGREEATFVAKDGATRFELRGEIARGGMGRIVEGWDPRHGRGVAVKLLLDRSASASVRFANEARITACLQHPAIVPIYDSGYTASGEPFYVMKLVEGRTLAEAVGACGSLEQRLALLPHVIAITDALAYAHSRRVIHRDLKPSNVLLGAYGETVVVDWGLAKELDAPPVDESEGGLFDAPNVTIAGRAVGTPRYMAPEQARGEPVDERSDVYALGALLYQLLAGVPPYQGLSAADAVEHAKAGPPKPVTALEPRAPAELAAIVAKAMARSPVDRYATAAEMAADLKRFAAGQLVSVHTYTIGALVRRWASRHAAVLGVTALLLLVLATVATLSVRRIVRERDRVDAANLVALHEKEAAITQRDAAEKLVAFVVTSLRDRLEQLGRLDLLAGAGQQVNAYYESVAPLGAGADLGVLERRASAAETLAGVEEAKHEAAEARVLYESAQSLRDELVTRQTGSAAVEARVAQGMLLARRARFELSQRSVAAAVSPAERAAALGDAIVAADPGDAHGLALVAEAHSALAATHKRDGKLDVAGTEASRAIDAARHLVELAPTADSLRVLGRALDEAAAVDQLAGRFQCDHVDEEVGIRERLVASTPDDTRDQLALGNAYEQRAFCRRDGNRLDLALGDAARAEKVRVRLAQHDPDNSEWQRLVGQSNDTLCSVQQLAGHQDDAIASCRESVTILQRLAYRTPDDSGVQDNLLLADQRLGWVLEQSRRFPEAAAALHASLEIAERFAGQDKRFVNRLADAHALLADVANQQGDRRSAREHFSKVVELLEPLLQPGGLFEMRRTLMLTKGMLAEIDDASGDRDDARRQRASALRLLVDGPLDFNDEHELLGLSQMCGLVLPTSDPALRDTLRRAIALLQPLRVAGSDPGPRLATLARVKRTIGP